MHGVLSWGRNPGRSGGGSPSFPHPVPPRAKGQLKQDLIRALHFKVQKTTYLIGVAATNADLGYIPNVAIVTTFAPHFGHGPRPILNVDIQCSNCATIHVIPELKTRPLGGLVSWAEQTCKIPSV